MHAEMETKTNIRYTVKGSEKCMFGRDAKNPITGIRGAKYTSPENCVDFKSII